MPRINRRAGATVFVAAVVLHLTFSDQLGPAITAGLATVPAVAMGWQAHRLAGRPRLGVIIISLALASNAIADLTQSSWAALTGVEAPFPGPADGFYLAFYPAMTAGLLWLVKLQNKGGDRTAVLDAAIVSVGAGVVLWQFLIVPLAGDTELGTVGRITSAAYPVGDLLLLAVTARLALLGGRRSPALRLLIAALLMLFVADVVYSWTELQGTYSVGSVLDVFYDLSYGLFTLAALHPSFTDLLVAADGRRIGARWGRLGLLTAATLLAPTVAALHATASMIVPVGASAVMFLLVMARVGGLMIATERTTEQRFRTLVQHANDIVLVMTPDGKFTYSSPSTDRAFGLTPDDANVSLFDRVHPEDVAPLRSVLVSRSAPPGAGLGPTTVEARISVPGHGWRSFELTITDLLDDPDIGGFVLNGHDIDDLRRLASFDQLTGLANRTELTGRVEAALASDGWHALMLYDLDGFKEINDSLGHAAGDEVLTEVGRRLTRAVRRGDVVARLGGDEFAVLTTDPDIIVEAFAARTLETLGEPIVLGDLAVSVEASLGIAVRRPEHHDPHELLRDADLAMYAAKAAGKGRAMQYEPGMGQRVVRHMAVRSALRGALADDQLLLHYQPVFELATGRLEGFEALLRWCHPERGWISPGEFIPAAEESNQIIVIGRWVLDQAAHQLAQWQRLDRGLTMAVNLSPRQLADTNLVSDVARIISDAGIEPANICLEITEGAVVDNAAVAARVLAELRRVGVQLAIDDYGSGNASINYLRQFDVNTLKIDRSLVAHLDECATNQAIVRSIIELAAALGLTTVGEGIETEGERAILAGLGCAIGQGYLLARPMDAATATRVVREHHAAVIHPLA